MNAPFRPPIADEDFQSAVAAVNGWRGRCLDAFATAELAVSEALLRSPAKGRPIHHPQLVGARMQRLADVLREAEATAISEALERFRSHAPLRAMLCHGKATVTLDRGRRWHAIFRMIDFAGGTDERQVLVVGADEADQCARALGSTSRRLCELLRAFPPRDDGNDRGG